VTPRTLLPVPQRPSDDPDAWDQARSHGPGGVAVIGPIVGADPVGREVGADPVGREVGAGAANLTELASALTQLAGDGVPALGHVSLGYAIRPPAEVDAEIAGWSALPVSGVFLDHAPAGPFQLGPVAHAVRAARRAGLRTVVLNPGVAVDPVYRRVEATICTFDGSWLEYVALPAGRCQPGDGHLVCGVPDLVAARELAAARRAGLLLATRQPTSTLGGPPGRGTPWWETASNGVMRGQRRGRRGALTA
jgi:hypothetical protein